MAIQLQNALKQPRAQAVVDALGAGGSVEIYTASFASLLVTFSLANPPTGSVSAAGAFSGASLPRTATAAAGGVASNYRVKSSGGTTLWQGQDGDVTATGGGGAVTITSTTITNGQAVNLTAFNWTE